MLRRSILFAFAGLLLRPGEGKAERPLVLSARDADVLARTIYGEAIGECEQGQIAVAHVIFNRVTSSNTEFARDHSVSAACLREGQFSCWRDKRRLRALDLTRSPAADLRDVIAQAVRHYRAGRDYSNGATFFTRAGTGMQSGTRVVARIGLHVFTKLKG